MRLRGLIVLLVGMTALNFGARSVGAQATPQADETPKAVCVSAPTAKVMSVPSTLGKVLATVSEGDILTVSGRRGLWYMLALHDPERVGYIRASQVKVDNTAAEPVAATAAPTPSATPAAAETPPPPPPPPSSLERRSAVQGMQAPPPPKKKGHGKGKHEMLTFGNLTRMHMSPIDSYYDDEATSSSSGVAMVNVGYFVSDHDEVGGGPTLMLTSSGYGTDTIWGLTGFYRHIFDAKPNSSWYPYVEGDFLTMKYPDHYDIDQRDTTFVLAGGGVKNYISQSLALDMKVLFGVNVGSNYRVTVVSSLVGFTYLF